MQPDGNAVVYGPSGAVFSTGTSAPSSVFVMQSDGNAVVYAPGPSAVFSTSTGGNPGAFIVLQSDNNLVVYSSGGTALWSAATGRITPPPPPAPTTNTLGAGGTLAAGQQLDAAGYRALMQTDGNFVVYDAANRPRYQTGTGGHPGSRFVLQTDGNGVVYSPSNQALFATGTSGNPNSRMEMQGDGNLVTYNSANQATWSFATGRIGEDPAPRKYGNCAELNVDYPHGVGLPDGFDKTSGTRVTTFRVNADVYNLNAGLDGDGDHIACEKL